MYADFTENTWPKLLNEDNFALQRDIQGEVWATPAWTHCLEYEYQLRKEALRLCFEEGFSIQGALWSAYADPQHRMKHWIQLLAIAICMKFQQQRRPAEGGNTRTEGGRT